MASAVDDFFSLAYAWDQNSTSRVNLTDSLIFNLAAMDGVIWDIIIRLVDTLMCAAFFLSFSFYSSSSSLFSNYLRRNVKRRRVRQLPLVLVTIPFRYLEIG